jgi:hypothetical protein
VSFRLVQNLSWSNSHTSSFSVLCCGKIMSCLRRYVAGCYFYNKKNRLTDIANFRLCYNLNKHTSDYDYILRLYLTLHADCILRLYPILTNTVAAVIRLLSRMNTYKIVIIIDELASLSRWFRTRPMPTASAVGGFAVP